MSVQDLWNKRDEEIILIYEMITHPAGFIIDMFGGMLTIRSHSDGYEVSFEEMLDGMECTFYKDFRHDEAKEAATLFIEKRFELEIGINIENELMKEIKNETQSSK